MYRVIYQFFDKVDNHLYQVGDRYEGTEERIKYLLGKDNPANTSLIQYEDEKLVPDSLTRDQINAMNTRQLKKLAKENGLKQADAMVRFELVDFLIEKLGL